MIGDLKTDPIPTPDLGTPGGVKPMFKDPKADPILAPVPATPTVAPGV